jgi:HrpA-like RNA helicase
MMQRMTCPRGECFPLNVEYLFEGEKYDMLIQTNELLAATEQRMLQSLQELKFILAATAGTGKTTQITAWLLDQVSIQGRIIVIEPRRQLAMRASRLVRLHLGEENAHLVGSVVRFENDTPQGARLVFMTVGVFFELWGANPSLEGIGAVIFDEAHEQDTQSIFLEGMVRGLRKTSRPDLVIGAMSATINTEVFATRWGVDPITYKARRFPLDIHYRSWKQVEDVVEEIMAAQEPGLILVFQPGKAEIAACEEVLRKRFPKLEIRFLHSELESEELEAAFAETQDWVVTLATNAVEAGVTFPHQRCYVVDTGLERYNIYDPVLDVDFLPMMRVSDQSATQRAERAPRNGPGAAYRLWDSSLTLPDRRSSEIQRSRLSGALLRMLCLGIDLDEMLGDLLEAPPAQNIEAGLRELERLGAIDSVSSRVVTTIGRQMNALPLEPRISRAVIDAACQGCLPVFLTLAALQSVRMSLLLCPKDQEERQAARKAHAAFRREEDTSDLYALLRAYEALQQEEQEEQGDVPAFAREHFLSYRAYSEATQIREQLVKKMRRLGFRWQDEHRTPRAIQLARSLWRGCRQHLVYYDPQVKCWKLLEHGDVEHRVLIGHESFAPQDPVGHTLGLASGLRRIVSRDQGILLLASEVMLLSTELVAEMFPDQVAVATSYRYDPQLRAVVRVEGCYWSGAGETPLCLGEQVTSLQGEDLDVIPSEATRALAGAIASGAARPFSFGYRTTQRRRAAIHRLRTYGGVEVPLVDNALLTELLMQQLGGATTLRAVDSGDCLKVTWGAFEKALQVPGLRRLVELKGALAQV